MVPSDTALDVTAIVTASINGDLEPLKAILNDSCKKWEQGQRDLVSKESEVLGPSEDRYRLLTEWKQQSDEYSNSLKEDHTLLAAIHRQFQDACTTQKARCHELEASSHPDTGIENLSHGILIALANRTMVSMLQLEAQLKWLEENKADMQSDSGATWAAARQLA